MKHFVFCISLHSHQPFTGPTRPRKKPVKGPQQNQKDIVYVNIFFWFEVIIPKYPTKSIYVL